MIAYLDCFSGISGDMLLGAIVDAGADLDQIIAEISRLPVDGYHIEHSTVVDHGIRGVQVGVRLTDDVEQPHRRLADIALLLTGRGLSPRAEATALRMFERLAVAEAHVHGTSPDDVTFHEVGAIDSIVDIVGICVGMDILGIDRIFCSSLPLTSGRVTTAHGDLPVPAPATVELLRSTAATWRPVSADGELVTPTGAAILAEFATFSLPSMTVSRVGYGFGRRKLPWANCLRVIIGDAPDGTDGEDGSLERDEIAVLESNLDNTTGESLGWLQERLFALGALDVSFTPLGMKKNRPGVLLTVLVPQGKAATFSELILRESSTLGVRHYTAARVKAPRRQEIIETPYGPVRVKLKLLSGRVHSVSPEYDDCKDIAAREQRSFDEIYAKVLDLARARFSVESSGE